MTYNGEVEITGRDEAAHRAVMKARAKKSRGQGTADADVTVLLAERNGGTSATVTTDVQLSGKVATMGQGVLQDVSRRLVETFAGNLATMLEGREVAEPAAAGEEARERAVAAGSPPGSEPTPAPADAEPALDLGSLGTAVITTRFRDPRVLGGLLATVALVAFVIGRRSRGG